MRVMGTKKDQLRGALRRNTAPSHQEPPNTQQILEGQPVASSTTEALRGASYTISTTVPLADLPPEAAELGDQLQALARQFLGARRRLGQALLDAANTMQQARDAADEGQWLIFLRVIQTSPDLAERLINIHLVGARDPLFKEAVTRGFLNQSVASELARASIPPEVRTALLTAPEPPRVEDVRRAIRAFRQTPTDHHHVENVDKPHFAESPDSGELPGEVTVVTQPAWLVELCTQLQAAAHSLELAQGNLVALDDSAMAPLRDVAERLLRALDATTRTLDRATDVP
jgi:hypothetical protein